MKYVAILIVAVALSGCAARLQTASRPDAITPIGEMPEQFRVRSMFSTPSDTMMLRYNDFAEKMNLWVWDYARGKSNTRAARAAEGAFNRLTATPGWSPRQRHEVQ